MDIISELQNQISTKFFSAVLGKDMNYKDLTAEGKQELLIVTISKMLEKPELEINMDAFIPLIKPILKDFLAKTLNKEYLIKNLVSKNSVYGTTEIDFDKVEFLTNEPLKAAANG